VSSADVSSIIGNNLQEIHREIADACQRTGRSPLSVRLVAVTKYAEWSWVEALSSVHRVFGENRPQQLAERQSLMPTAEWHLIGQLQRNKVPLICGRTTLIHSVDSVKLLQSIADTARARNLVSRILLQVNVSGETSKSGFSVRELQEHWPEILQHSTGLQIEGLMTLAPESDDPDQVRPVFRSLAELRDQLVAAPETVRCGLKLPELSMGMSGDFVTAIEEGATLIRIGSRLFDGLQPAGN
jgi:PLP dependent protein